MSSLRSGYTTGACAAAAAKAAALLLTGVAEVKKVEIALPDGERVRFPVVWSRSEPDRAEAAVRKDAGDDPDLTHQAIVKARIEWLPGEEVEFRAGEGVGVVTKPGLAVPPGEAAINPVPRQMIRDSLREVTNRGLRVTVSIPDGQALAAKTFNPKLGVQGGLSILGTTGRVRPFSCPALQESLRCSLRVALAGGVRNPVFVPGHIGERAAHRHFRLRPEQVIEVSNEWGYMLDQAVLEKIPRLLVLGHPGKLVKLAQGAWDTHSSRSGSALPFVRQTALRHFPGQAVQGTTVEGFLAEWPDDTRPALADMLAQRVLEAVVEKTEGVINMAVVLINLQGDRLGGAGDLGPWA
ncbi:MAG: cobalt-precorrin-5B (C(1))-methyltransferase CbiD [Desulfobacterota bacterium]|jgi:cobalt-precorrin-5B (C1)-methyltransferase|nr:cobalt-precorrin-5B (C(1))-methyltransferase CbiD [Thermodesulfobacteriota bacterium]